MGSAEQVSGNEQAEARGANVVPISPASVPSTGGSDGTNRLSILNPVDVVDLFKEVDREMSWIWDGYLSVGRLTLLAGPPKVGKTTLAYQLILALALGTPFLGREVTQGNVLILGLEEHLRDIVGRLQSGISEDMRGLVRVQAAPLPFNDSVLSELVTYIDENDIGLVVIDTLVAWWRLRDENDASEVIRQGTLLLDAIRRTSAAWLVLAHTRKGGGEHGEGIRGSSALAGIIDIAISMTRTVGGGPQRMLQSITRYQETPCELLIELKEEDYQVLGTPGEVSAAAKAEKLLAALNDSDQTTKELSAKTGLSKQDVSRAIGRLGDKVIPSGKGHKGDPYRYQRNAIRPSSGPMGESLDETNQAPTATD